MYSNQYVCVAVAVRATSVSLHTHTLFTLFTRPTEQPATTSLHVTDTCFSEIDVLFVYCVVEIEYWKARVWNVCKY